MIVKIDVREKNLHNICNKFIEKENIDNITIISEQLDLGDIIICDNSYNEIIMFERKSIYDLMSSIKDGRYNEQSFRLNGCNIPNHNILYILEGSIETNGFREINKKTFFSSVLTLNYFKGFSVLRTLNINETGELIIRFTDKIQRDKLKQPYYNNDLSNNIPNNNTSYVDVIHKVKKENITEENIGEIMLSQIPGISNQTAKCIMVRYKTIKNLILTYNENELSNLCFKTVNNKERKISKTAIINIKKFIIDK